MNSSKVPNPPYDYWPITDRPRLEWPDGKGLAFYLGLNIESFRPGVPATGIYGGTAALPVDPMNHGWRDYSLRVGVWRMMKLLDDNGLRASVLLNADICAENPEIVSAGVERDWAWLGHGRTNSEFWTGIEAEDERAALAAIAGELRAATGSGPKGWLGPAMTETENTLPLLAEQGFTYTLDWCADDQPFPVDVPGHRFVSVPYSVEVNDIAAFLVLGMSPAEFKQAMIDHFDLLYQEAKERPGSVCCIALHPFLMAQPFRHRYLAEALEYIRAHDDVWFTTSDEIAAWYLANGYDEAVETLATRRAATAREAG